MPYHSQFTTLRQESIEGDLCGNCFTIFEVAEGAKLKDEADAAAGIIK